MMTERMFYENVYATAFEGVVEEIRQDGNGQWVRLDRTCFYPEGGGQPCDIGTLEWKREPDTAGEIKVCRARVVDVQEKDNGIWHRIEEVQELEGENRHRIEKADQADRDEMLTDQADSADGKRQRKTPAAGMTVSGEIDWNRRLDLMQQHSGEHIVSGLIHERFGYDNVGFHLTMDSMTVDLSGELSWDELMEIEAAANRLVRENRPIEITYPSAEELAKLPYRSKKELSGEVRIVTIPGGDICACCGTHVTATGEIGLIKITAMQKWKSGVRLWMCCGERAENYCRMTQEQNRRISVALSAKPEETAMAVERVSAELAGLKMTLTGWKYRLYGEIANRFAGRTRAVLFEDDFSMDDLRHLADKVMDVCGECFVFSGKDGDGYRYTVGRRGGDVRALVKSMNSALAGRGGGKNEMAQGTLQAKRSDIEAWISMQPERE